VYCPVFAPRPLPFVVAFVKKYNFRFDHEFTTAVGGVIGLDEDHMKAWMLDQVRDHALLFRVLSHPNMRTWLAHHMLRTVLLSKMNHLLRTHSPAILRDAAQLFDKCVLEVFALRFNVPEVAPHLRVTYRK
jgi:hypothetical protein